MDERLLNRKLSAIEECCNQLIREVNSLRQFQASVEQEKQVQVALELMSRMQASHASYANLIIAAGYAAFFAFWSTLKTDLPNWLYAVSGLSIVLSLLIFIAWEVTKIIRGAFHLRKAEYQLTSRPPGPDTIYKLQQEINAFERRMNRLWLWFLVPTVIFGLAGGLSLLGFFMWKLRESL